MADGHDFDAVFYVKNAPDIRVEEGHFHICYKVGRANFEFVMRPSVYAKSLRRANQASDEFHADGADVVQIKGVR